MPASAFLLLLVLIGEAGEPTPRQRGGGARRPSAHTVEQFKQRTGLSFARCSTPACLREHEKQGCRPAHLARAYVATDGTEVLVDELVHPPSPGDAKHPRDTGCVVTSFTFFTRDCTLYREQCPELDFLPGYDEPGCPGWPMGTLACSGSPVSPAKRRQNLALAEKKAEDELRVFATPTLIGVRGGTWSGLDYSRLDYSRALVCLANEVVVAPPAACVDLGAALFGVLEAGDGCRTDADCSVLRAAVPAGACCVAVGAEAQARLRAQAWPELLRAACGSTASSCPSCTAASCVEGRCRLARGDVKLVWLGACGF